MRWLLLLSFCLLFCVCFIRTGSMCIVLLSKILQVSSSSTAGCLLLLGNVNDNALARIRHNSNWVTCTLFLSIQWNKGEKHTQKHPTRMERNSCGVCGEMPVFRYKKWLRTMKWRSFRLSIDWESSQVFIFCLLISFVWVFFRIFGFLFALDLVLWVSSA